MVPPETEQDEPSVRRSRAKRIALSMKETHMNRTPPDINGGPPDLDEMPLQITTRRDGDSVSILLSGDLDLSSTGKLDAAIRDVEETDIGRIIVDLSEITFVDSTGLSVLLGAKKRSNGRFSVIPGDHDAVTRLLELTGTAEILDC